VGRPGAISDLREAFERRGEGEVERDFSGRTSLRDGWKKNRRGREPGLERKSEKSLEPVSFGRSQVAKRTHFRKGGTSIPMKRGGKS